MARTKQKVIEDRRAQVGETSAAGDGSNGAAPAEDKEQNEKRGSNEDEGEESEEEEFVVERIVSQRVVRNKLQYEVKWRDDDETTWEPAINLKDTEALEVCHSARV